MKIRRFNENSDEFNILEDVAQEYIDKYHLTEFKSIDSLESLYLDSSIYWGVYRIISDESSNMIIFYVRKDKVDGEEFYQDVNKLSMRLKSLGWTNKTGKNDISSAFTGFSVTLQTKDDLWKSLWDDKNENKR